jgi:aminopeptidase C
MQKIVSLLAVIAIVFGSFSLSAQEETKKEEGYKFTTQKECKYTSVKNQHRSGTCWSFSGIGFLECELLRMGKGEYDLADMWIVNRAYVDKAQIYVRMHGNYNFGGGGAFFDVFNMIDKYGIMPQSAYIGLSESDTLPVHNELDALLKAYVGVIVKNPNKTLSTTWQKGYEAVVNTYLGQAPAEFTYNGKKYTPTTFAQSLGLNMNDFISITSFTHHPFYTKFALEIPDNWIMEESYNLPLDEMMQVMNYAVDNGYSIAWGSDVSTKGFNWSKGIAIVPEKDFSGPTAGSDREKWEKLSQSEKDEELYTFDKPGKEKTITQEMRQEGFDNWTTTDDHGMVIVGRATDQNGTPYFIVKNSWGTAGKNPYKGFFYASQPFVEMQTINFVVHKNAIPKAIKDKLGIK